MTEETHNAAMAGSIGIVMSIGVSAILGWFLILGLLFSIQDYDSTIASPTGQPVTQIFLDTVGQNGAIVLMVRRARNNCQSYGASIFCRSSSSARCSSAGTISSLSSYIELTLSFSRRTFSVTSNSRMMYAFSRDGAIPGSSFFHKVDRRWRSPIRTGASRPSVPPLPSFLSSLGKLEALTCVCVCFF